MGPNRRATTEHPSVPVATGDRFKGGTIVPRGLGSGGEPEAKAFNSAEINSALQALASEFEQSTNLFEAPHKTHENRTTIGITLTSGCGTPGQSRRKIKGRESSHSANPDDPANPADPGIRAYLQAGIHSRERGGPDHMLYFLSDLLWASREGTGLRYGGRAYTASEVQTALRLGIAAIPNLNPDGLAHDQATNLCWRKNRNPASRVPDPIHPEDDRSVGVDLNRNYDAAWNFTHYFSSDAYPPASADPNSEAFYGTGPLSEPETRNSAWVLDRFPSVAWFVDLHAPANAMLYGSFFDTLQSADPDMNWQNPEYDDVRGVVADNPTSAAYGEYVPQEDWDALILAAERMAWGIRSSGTIDGGPRVYQGALFAPTSGSSTDFAYNRHFVDSEKQKVLGIGFEFGDFREDWDRVPCPFYPTAERYTQDMKEVGAGLMEFLLTAARLS
ncbi:Zn-dependent exopeptidase [Sodiomyces alkalinus F11]|uniref:Zn-dependent exopeptidase n=1 Tax=Sodiomyces alkalinus (strain CBS 110278 / VKM F-3762 / F11) TaxID=1314773 RepID=A0A3N2QAI1_SODAK|nr:Zn-dependent exopeptidase [Sodiomyces alkalinus F11]ROT43754.1 Zn-dependent exopeptidase [Sodiomyces alkalinus F11]